MSTIVLSALGLGGTTTLSALGFSSGSDPISGGADSDTGINNINIGSQSITNIYVGSTQVTAVYVGSTLVYQV